MTRTGLCWIGVAAVVIVGCSKTESTKARSSEQSAARPPAVGTGGAGADVKDDGEFVRDVAGKIAAEIELSRMAADRATRAEVKAFAQMMVRDHGASENKLKSVLSGQAIEWPAQLDAKHKETADDLANKQGADFDRAYAKAMVEGHENLAAKLESRLDVQSLNDWKAAAAGRTQNKSLPDPKTEMSDVGVRPAKSDNGVTVKINQWSAETYPTVQKHLDSARTLENSAKRGTD